jgi:hypothetical protein
MRFANEIEAAMLFKHENLSMCGACREQIAKLVAQQTDNDFGLLFLIPKYERVS